MPSLTAVKASNANYAPSYIPTAVFVGGTSGIGEAMAKLLARQTNGRANIIIVGRNKAAAERIIAGFPTPPSQNGTTIKHEFIHCDASSLENVHTVSQELLTRLDKINMLVLSLSTYAFSPLPAPDGLELATVLRYYARAKFMHELMPLLENAREKGEDAKVMSVLAAAMGRNVDLNDLGIKKWSIIKMAGTLGTYNDIMIKVCAVSSPTPHAYAMLNHAHGTRSKASDILILLLCTYTLGRSIPPPVHLSGPSSDFCVPSLSI
jgi:hypothetical protein